MAAGADALREAVGGALRRLRQQGQFSLDEIERGSAGEGMRITRSHLSRVETGKADLSLPRFLALVKVLGEPPGVVAEQLAACAGTPEEAAPGAVPRAAALLAANNPAGASRLLRAAARPGASIEALELLWRAESALGRWLEAAAAVELRAGVAGDPPARDLLRIAAARLAAGQVGLARALARAAARDAPGGAALVEAAALLAAGDAVGAMAAAPDGAPGLLLRAETLRRQRRARAVRGDLERLAAAAPATAIAGEAWLILARIDGDARRAQAGLRALERSRAVGRALGAPELVLRAHVEERRLCRLAGDLRGANTALRAARALALRTGARCAATSTLPLQALVRGFETAP